jgi:hypothetical protein
MRSRDRLCELLAASDGSLRAYAGDVLYHVQVEFTCQLLDVVDEVVDETTAMLITDAIYGRLSGTGVAEADARVREARERVEQLAREPVRISPDVLWEIRGGQEGGQR